jgi:two-component system response regulator QseB
MYLVVAQSVATALAGARLPWRKLERHGQPLRSRCPLTDPPGQSVRLLLVEEAPALTDPLARLLTDQSYQVDMASDARQALRFALTRTYDVVVLDRDMATTDALDLLTLLRTTGGLATPTLLLSALGDPADRVAGLDAGADDYLVKPFDSRELLARLRALRRRHLDTTRWLRVPGGVLDVDARLVSLRGRPGVRLSARECGLLAILAARPQKVFYRDELRALVFDDAGVEIVDTYVHYLRRKLGRTVVDTVRGRGYQLGSLR